MPAKITIEPKTERELADALRNAAGLTPMRRYPLVGDIVEVTKDGVTAIGICIEYRKGWCYVRTFDDEGELHKWLDFVSDEDRHGPSGVTFRIRDDLAAQ